jgi:hypothetical protein
MRHLGLALPLILLLITCSKPKPTPMAEQLAGVAVTPLNDLNLVRAKIPSVLLTAMKAPYAPPVDPTCEGLAREIQSLDAALGADLDAPHAPDPSIVERGKTEAGAAVVGVVKSAAEALIPYRGWVRKLTGAERASRQVTKAIAAGIVRRAYLKGLGQARGCPPPATPNPTALAQP